MAKQLINSLQVARGLAALAVVVHHASLSTDAFVQGLPAVWMRLFDLGALGVDFFFVLSGFIIMHAHQHEAGNCAAIRPYLAKRLLRIFPAYWPIGIALLGLYAAFPGVSASGGREFSYVSSLLLIPANLPPALSVAWTLVHELLFYAVFMLWFVSRRAFGFGLLLWAAVIAVAKLSGDSTGWMRYPLSMLNLEFMLGVAAAWLYARPSLRFSPGILIAGGGGIVAISTLLMMYVGLPAGHRLELAFGLALLMLGLARWEQARPIAWPIPLLALGNASYSIYLVHNPLVSVTQRLAGRLDMSWPVAMLWGVGLSLAVGYLYFLGVERRVMRLFRGADSRKMVLKFAKASSGISHGQQ